MIVFSVPLAASHGRHDHDKTAATSFARNAHACRSREKHSIKVGYTHIQ